MNILEANPAKHSESIVSSNPEMNTSGKWLKSLKKSFRKAHALPPSMESFSTEAVKSCLFYCRNNARLGFSGNGGEEETELENSWTTLCESISLSASVIQFTFSN